MHGPSPQVGAVSISLSGVLHLLDECFYLLLISNRAITIMGAQTTGIQLLILKLLPNPMGMGIMRLNLITLLLDNILGIWARMGRAVHIQVMVLRTNTVSHQCTACRHKHLILNPTASLGQISLEKCLTRVLAQPLNLTVKICPPNNLTPTGQVHQCNKATLPTVVQLMDMVILPLQHLLLHILLKVVNPQLGMVSLELNSHLHILSQHLQGPTGHIRQLKLAMLSNQMPIMLLMGTKGLLTRPTVLPKLNRLILRLLLDKQAMLRRSLPMISLVGMEMCLQQLLMGKALLPRLRIHNMTPVRCMAHIVEFLVSE